MFDLRDLAKNKDRLKPVILYLGREVNTVGYQGEDIVHIPETIQVPGIQIGKHYRDKVTSYVYVVDREKLLQELKNLKQSGKKIDTSTLNLIDELEELKATLVFITNQEIEYTGNKYDGIYHKIKLSKNVRHPKKSRL